MPSSVKLGSRPRMVVTCWYSSGLRPWRAMRSGVMTGSCMAILAGRGREAVEEGQAVLGAEQAFGGAFGVRHQADNIPALVADARDVVRRAVGIGLRRDGALGSRVAEDHLPRRVQ